MKRTPLVILLVVIIALLVLVLVWGIVSSPSRFFRPFEAFNADLSTVSEFAADTDGIKRLAISVSVEDIEIKTGQSNQIEVKQSAINGNLPENRKMRCGVDGDALVIEGADRGRGISCFSSSDYSTIVIWLPKGFVPELACQTMSGRVDVEDISCATGSISAASGDVNVQDVSCGDSPLSISTASGEVFLVKCGSGETKISTASGDVNLDDCTLGSLNVGTASGEIWVHARTDGEVVLESASGEQDYVGSCRSLDCSSASGSVRAELSSVESLVVDTTSGDVGIVLPEASRSLHSVNVDTASGAVGIRLPKGTAINPNFESVSGNMKIDSQSSFTIGDGAGSIEIDVDTTSGDLEILSN